MGFINKKQNIIDITLTSYGKELLSKGIISFEYFKLIDDNSLYASSSEDYSVESLPILEPITDIDIYQNQIFDGEIFVSNYPKVGIINNVVSSSIKRTTSNLFESDSILAIALSENNLTSVISRIESLKNRGQISDFSSSISFNRSWTNVTPQYLVQVEISSSDQLTKLLSSGSSFYICDDNQRLINKSSELNEANNIYEIIRIS